MTDDERLRKLRVASLSAVCFLIMLGYSLARPATESLFLESQGSEALPGVWVLVALAVTVTVVAYGWVVAHLDLVRLFGGAAAISAGLLVILLLVVEQGWPGAYHALYVWKDVYIVVLVEIFYSYANSVFPIRTARWVYGLFGALGSLGGLVGNLAVGVLAERWGTAQTLWLVPPLLLLIAGLSVPFARAAGLGAPLAGDAEATRPAQAARVVGRSSYLLLVLLLIALAQAVITLIDFEYNAIVESTFPEVDSRTRVIGQIYAGIAAGNFALHALTGPVLRLVGVPLTLIGIPLLLATGVGAFAVVRRFATAAVIKITGKCLDYTLFRASKEILYIPLSYAERTQGKSIVDMFTYRVAKGGASLLLMGLVAIGLANWVPGMTLVLLVVWLVVTVVVVRRFRRRVSREDELRSS